MEVEKKLLLDELDYLLKEYKEINYESISRIINRMTLLSSYNEMADVALKLSSVSNYISDELLLNEIVKQLKFISENVTSQDAIATMWVALCHVNFSIGFNFKVIEYGLKYIGYEKATSDKLRAVYNDIAISCFEIEDYRNALEYTIKAYDELKKMNKGITDPERIQNFKCQTILAHINRALNNVFLNDTKTANEEVSLYNDIWANELDEKHKNRYELMIKFYNIYIGFMIGNDRGKSIQDFLNFMYNEFKPSSLNIALTYQQYVDLLNFMMEKKMYEDVIKIAQLIKQTKAFRGSPIFVYFLELKATYILDSNENNDHLSGLLLSYESENHSYSDYQKKIMRSMIAEQVKINTYEKKYSSIKQQYEIDPLTNAYNRLGLELNATKYMQNKNGSIIFIDLDGLKTINDKFGHESGDRHLFEFAKGALKAVGKNGNVYRYGGDEFIIITKYAGSCTSYIIDTMERIFEKPYTYKGHDFYIRFSYGIVDYSSNSISLSDIIVEADKRMYGLKEKHHSEKLNNIDTQHIQFYFRQSKENLGQCAAWNEKIKTMCEQEEWVEKMKERSRMYRLAYKNFESFKDNVVIPILLGEIKLDDELAQIIFDEVVSFDDSVTDDYLIIKDIIKILINYYEQKDDFRKLIRLYRYLGVEQFNAIKKGIKTNADEAFDYFCKVLSYSSHYGEIEEVNYRRMFFSAYYNIIARAPRLKLISYTRMFSFYKEMMRFVQSDMVSSIDKNTVAIVEIVNDIKYSMLEKTLTDEDVPSDIKDKLSEMAFEEYKKEIIEKNVDIYSLNPKVYISFLAAQQYDGKMSYNQIIYQLMNYYDKHSAFDKLFIDAKLENYLQIEIPNIIVLSWLDKSTLSEETKNKIRLDMIRRKNYYLTIQKNGSFKKHAIKEMAVWSMKTLKYINGPENQQKYIKQYLLKNQIHGDVHAGMTVLLSKYLVKKLIEYKPEYFISFNNYSSSIEVVEHENDIIKFVQNACLVHDIGKASVQEIGDIQYRKINQDEYEIIQNHVKIGYDLVSQIDYFEPYKDIILGHHKAYNNEFGYPSIFNINKSKVRSIIDIISLSDSLDAATDLLDRNYKPCKSVEEMLVELKKGSGNRYSPIIVSLILDNPDVIEGLRNILTTEREKIYYNFYSGDYNF